LLQELHFLRESAMEDLLKGSESVGRGSSGGGADLFVDPQRLQMRSHSEEDRALLWNMVDAMKADWQRSSDARHGSWPDASRDPASSSRANDGGRNTERAENGLTGDFLRNLPIGIPWPFASWTNNGQMCTMCTRDGCSDVEYCGAASAGTSDGRFEEEAFQQTEGTRLDELEASQGDGTLPYRTPRGDPPPRGTHGRVAR